MIYVVSAPRSGLNWLRFCIEYYLGVKTPGHDILVKSEGVRQPAFIRAHNARKGSNSNKGTALGDITKADDKVLLLVRNPLETFVRSADRRFKRYNNFVENIRYFDTSPALSKLVAYYEEHTTKPEVMAGIIRFLDIPPAPGFSVPDAARLTDEWKSLSDKSRATYDKQQAHGGGSMTQANPTDFSFHQRALSEAEKQQVWRFLKRKLTPGQMKLLERYYPAQGIKKVGPVTTLRDYWRALT